MLPLSEETIRASFVNATRKDVTDVTLPAGFSEIRWDRLDYLGWRDPRAAKRAYLVVAVDGVAVGVILKQAEASPRSRAQCAWCEDVHLPNDVVLYSAKRSGPAGRNGNTIGTLVCSNFECSANVRKLPPVAYIGFDVEAARARRIEVLRMHASAFAADVLNGS